MGVKEIFKERTDMRGFTLAEMLVAVMILALVSMLALPATLARIPYHRMDRVSSRIKAHMRSARLKAMMNGSPVRVVFKDKELNYSIWTDHDGDGFIGSEENNDYGISDVVGVKFATPSATTGQFNPDGFFTVSGSTANLLMLNITSSDISRRDYLCIWPSGQVSVFEYN